MYIQSGSVPLRRRNTLTKLLPRATDDKDDNGGSNSRVVTIIVIAVIVILILAILVSYTGLRRMRARGKTPRYLPSSLAKRWQSWTPRSKYAQVNSQDGRNLSSTNTAYGGAGSAQVEERAANQAAAAGVDRNTSVRSVMTLPPYSQAPKDSEQVIAREGERGGMDTVVEFPETVEEEEGRREDQMESLYQIRLARRREVAEREERRRERREARERGDSARLEELRRESRQRASESQSSLNAGLSASAATLIAEHNSRGRDRRVSSVAYGALGEVRHDGTRIRANSAESERGGLLEGAAPMGENRSDGASLNELGLPRPSFASHTRSRSGSSALSISTTTSDLDNQRAFTPTSTQPNSDHHARASESTSNESPTANRFTPEDSTGSDDIGESRIPPAAGEGEASPRPPDYEHLDWGDAPVYTERQASIRRNASQRAWDQAVRSSTATAPQIPSLNLPSISIEGASEPNTPRSPPSAGARDSRRISRREQANREDEDFM